MRCAAWDCGRRSWRQRFCRRCRCLLDGSYGYVVTEFGLVEPPSVSELYDVLRLDNEETTDE